MESWKPKDRFGKEKSPLAILTGFSRLDGGIDETLTTSHGVEEELRWGESGEVGVLDEAARFRAVVVLDEVRQGSLPETERNSLTLDVLLTDASNDLM